MLRSKGDAKQSSASQEDAMSGPLEYLFTSSEASVESFHLTRLNRVANLRKELHEIFEEWVEAEVQARLAQWILARKNPERAAAGDSSLARVTTIEPSDSATIAAAIGLATTGSAALITAVRPMNRPTFTRSATACSTMQSPALVHPHSILNPRKLSKALLRAPMNSSRIPPSVNKQSRHRLTLLPLSRCK
jgi:hypothetical protein